MSGSEPPPRLNDLDARLRRLRQRTTKEEQAVRGTELPNGSAWGFGLRGGGEPLAALLVGGGIGWLLDRWLGTMPLFLLICFFLGAGAGLLNVFRAAREMNR